jgi:hypothetical protein
MEREFEMTDLGEMKFFLGLEVDQQSSGIFISQKKYSAEILYKHRMDQCKSVPTPLDAYFKFNLTSTAEKEDPSQYRSLVGSLLYLCASRPDLMFSTAYLASFMQSPTTEHYAIARRVLRFIAGTVNHGIWYGSVDQPGLYAYADSDWAGESSMKSRTGYCFSFGYGIFSWSSKRQDCVAQSTGEAEYIALNMTVRQAIWIRQILTELKEMPCPAINILSDAKAAIAIAENPVQHGRTKHINVKYHFIRGKIEANEVTITYISSQNQLADFFTKSLPCSRYNDLKLKLGIIDSSQQGGDVGYAS